MENNYTKEELLDILGAIRRQIIRGGKEYPTAVIDDIFSVSNHVLDYYNYNGKYAEDAGKKYK